ncbi:Wadjet anti-phage system protein JetD domain-containing protein [Heliorestis convoluta]|nr:Wadjet anti-phage system protein JetD domain-containing protein [Heliorestis convoluta]
MSTSLRALLLEQIEKHHRKRIDIYELLQNAPGETNYQEIATVITDLLAEKLLEPVKSKGFNNKKPPLPHQLRINKTALQESFFDALNRFKLQLHPAIDLSAYYRLGAQAFEKDRHQIVTLNKYLLKQDSLLIEASLPERSYEIFGDEKYLEEKKGLELLQRLGITAEDLSLQQNPDPVMFALHKELYQEEKKEHCHLIVENKTAFHILLPYIQAQSFFTTLIYGQGKAIIATLRNFKVQACFSKETSHSFYYYGDIDREGLSIFYSLHQRYKLQPCLPFYKSLLTKRARKGKEYQRLKEEALANLETLFPADMAEKIKNILQSGTYLPQEALSTEETERIWREESWIQDYKT